MSDQQLYNLLATLLLAVIPVVFGMLVVMLADAVWYKIVDWVAYGVNGVWRGVRWMIRSVVR